MKKLIKPRQLRKGDTIATVSPCNGWSGDEGIKWKYELGTGRLKELGLHVAAASNSIRGSDYLARNPKARAEDIMWAFENRDVQAIIANAGGNDSIKLIPYIDPGSISDNPKIFIGYSDVMNLHLLCCKCGISTFYGDNLLTQIADQAGWHAYSKKWFEKTLFETAALGEIRPSDEWTFEPSDPFHPEKIRKYYPNTGYEIIQGQGCTGGRLFGGHTGIMELEGTAIEPGPEDYEDTIPFIEDIPEFFDEESVKLFFDRLGQKGILHKLKGVIIGKVNEKESFAKRSRVIRQIVSGKYSCEIPVIYGLNFGHSSPSFILPYGAYAEIDCDKKTFSILESGTV